MRLRHLIVSVFAVIAVPGGVATADGGPIMPLSEVQPGMNCTALTVIQGTTISSFNVHVIDIVQQTSGAGEDRILVSVSGPAVAATGVAEGMSGSPVYCPDSSGTMENAGAISEGVGQYAGDVALVTPIQQMLGEPVLPPIDAPGGRIRFTARTRPLLGPLTVGGLSPALMAVLQRAGQRVGRTIVAAPSQGAPTFPVQQLVPGASVGVQYSSGTISTGAIGTVTYTDGPIVYAFGHELDGAGRRSLLLDDAYVYYVVNDPNPDDNPGSYKLASPGHPLGTLTSDTPNAVIGELGALPQLIPIQVTAHDLDTGRTITEDTQVADETDIGLPLGSSMLDTVAPLAVGQAAIDVYDGPPASESGRMCLRIQLRESRQPLGFCKRYVGTGAAGDMGETPPELANGVSTDVASAFSVLDEVQFARLHVTSVQATIWAERGLAEASILSAHARSRLRAGATALVHLRVRLYRGSIRTISFRLPIPRRAHGALSATIRGPAFSPQSGGSGANGDTLTIVIGNGLGGSGSGGSPPPTIAAVHSAIAAIGTYDGLQASFPGHAGRRVYTDPSLLISGSATLSFDVAG